ncbi:VanZ family protein [Oceanicaulis sp.]|uniref:VanZ family protein n=1 Tax=Oceanicaulis sp. TaxID=1924941 RepID=UPI003BA8BE3C
MSASEPVQNDRDGKKPAFKLQAMEVSAVQARFVFLGASLVIFGVALLPSQIEDPTVFGLDKLNHLAAFVVLTLLARASWPSLMRWQTALGLAGFGAAIELAQGLSRLGRTASLADFLADLIGIGLGLALLWGLVKWRAKHHA